MPLLQFYTSPGQLTAVEKQEMASTLTAKYAKIMPAFFVNVIFHEVILLESSCGYRMPVSAQADQIQSYPTVPFSWAALL